MRPVQVLADRLHQEMERGRGGTVVHPYPIGLEPRFSPFTHNQHPSRPQLPNRPGESPRVQPVPRDSLKFLRIRPSPQDTYNAGLTEQNLLALGSLHPLAFEVMRRDGGVSLQWVAAGQDAPNLAHQLRSHYPWTQVVEGPDALGAEGVAALQARGYRLRDSHLFQIRVESRQEPLVPLIAILANLGPGELALHQVLFQPARHPWQDNIVTVAGDPWDRTKSMFVDLPDLPRRARAKVERPLFAVAVRRAAGSQPLLDRLQSAFLAQLDGADNGLVPAGGSYPVDAVLGRFTRSEGMLLALPELAALVHLPDPSLVSEGLEVAQKSAPPPPLATGQILCPLGTNSYRGKDTLVGISGEQLTRHVAILGGTGSGKTNLMKVAFAPLMEQGYGLAVLDPKGDLAQGMLDLVPVHRVADVVWFDPSDRQHPPAFNMLQASQELSPEALAAELMIGLKRLFTGASEFGPRMEWLLRTAVRTLLASDGEKTLPDVRGFLEEPGFRTQVLDSVADRRLKQFWQGRNLAHNVIDPLLNRLSTFLDRPSIRDIVGQPNRVDLPRIMRERKIFIANLERGLLQDAAYVQGSFILSRLQLAALGRPAQDRGLFPVLVDEFHVYAGHGMDTEGIETFLSETRSYLAPLVVSTQYLGRLNRGVVAALFGNLGTQVCMSMGQIDAQMLQRELGRFNAEDLLNLGIGQAIVRMGSARDTFNVGGPLARQGTSHRDEIIRNSRERYCRPEAQVGTLQEDEGSQVEAQAQVWIADDRGNVFHQEHWPEYAAMTRRDEAAQGPPSSAGEEIAPPGVEEIQPTRAPDAVVDRELLVYLEHTANHPFASALERDWELALSRYKGGVLRHRLVEAGWVRLHKASTGKRSGQLLLLEVTEAGYELLSSMKIRVKRPRSRGGYRHKYYCHKLQEFAETAWPGSVVEIEDGSLGKYADVTVKMPSSSDQERQRVVAFEVFITGEAKEIRGIAKGIEVFDQIIVCAETQEALDSLRNKALEALGVANLAKVSFNLVGQYLSPNQASVLTGKQPAKLTNQPVQQLSLLTSADSIRPHTPAPTRVKNRAKPEAEVEPVAASAVRRGRKPKAPLMVQVEEALVHIHDLDWLQECQLAKLPEVQERINTRHYDA